jgi:hypothetical protein
MNILEKKQDEMTRILDAMIDYQSGKSSSETLRQVIKISLHEMYMLGKREAQKDNSRPT